MKELKFPRNTPLKNTVSQDELAELQRVCLSIAKRGGELGVLATAIREASIVLQQLDRRFQSYLTSPA